MCNSAPLEGRGQSSTFAVEFAVAHGLVEVVYRCLLRHGLRRLEEHFKPIGKAGGKLGGNITGVVLEPGTLLVGCPGSRCLKCRFVFHYYPPFPVRYARARHYWRWVQRDCGGHDDDDGGGDYDGCVRWPLM